MKKKIFFILFIHHIIIGSEIPTEIVLDCFFKSIWPIIKNDPDRSTSFNAMELFDFFQQKKEYIKRELRSAAEEEKTLSKVHIQLETEMSTEENIIPKKIIPLIPKPLRNKNI